MRISNNVNVQAEPFHLNYMKMNPHDPHQIHHAHPNMEFLYIHEGKGKVEINKKEYRMESGSLFVFQPFQPHKIVAEAGFVRSVYMFDPYEVDSRIAPFQDIHQFFHFLWKAALGQPTVYFPAVGNLIVWLFDLLHREKARKPKFINEENDILFMLSMLQALKPHQEEYQDNKVKKHHRAAHTMEAILNWVETHYKEKFELHQMSADLHLSTCYLSHMVRKITGSSITQIINVRRMKEAQHLLQTTTKSISVISEEVGFQTDSYFCRVFKSTYGIKPNEFRQSSQ